MMKPGGMISKVLAREVLDCRGNPTVEVDVFTESGALGRAQVPSGRSTGRREAFELRDGGGRYGGRGVKKAVSNVNRLIAPRIIGVDSARQREIDSLMLELDGTENISKLGANSVIGVSMAAACAAAAHLGTPLYRYLGGVDARVLPIPLLNVIGGGKLAAIDLEIQECILMPVGADSFSEALRMSTEVYFELGDLLVEKYGKQVLNLGDDGSYTPPISETRDALDSMMKAIENLGYQEEFRLALDSASTHFHSKENDLYNISGKQLNRGEMIDFYRNLATAYPLVSIEDPLDEDDIEGYRLITKTLNNVQIVGDDFLTTNPQRIKEAITQGAASALLLKVNQIGTLSRALEAAAVARSGNYNIVVSERSGETEDTFISDLTVALNAGQIKTGAPARSEHTAKFNRLLRIEEELGSSAKYGGKDFKSRR